MIQTADILSTTYWANGFPFEMITIEKRAKAVGEFDFMMGDDKSNYGVEKPAHPITFKREFEIGKFPVTQSLWEAIMGENTNPSHFKGANRPVEQVSWEDIVLGNEKEGTAAFLDTLNAIPEIRTKNLADGKQFRLPTEAQWEYAARGGKYWEALNFQYSGSNHIKDVAWNRYSSHNETKKVGLKIPNILELHDISGNVREWCEDIWHDNYKGAPEDGTAWAKGENKNFYLVRGGSWLGRAYSCRVTSRFRYLSGFRNYSLGFRLSRY